MFLLCGQPIIYNSLCDFIVYHHTGHAGLAGGQGIEEVRGVLREDEALGSGAHGTVHGQGKL